jgi:NDP-sugar pyrophosphorylase family protein
VNYRAEQIVNHFGDGQRFGIRVRYLHESKRMGTAGALSLIGDPIRQPFLVTNADLLIKEDIARMVDVHVESGATATMGVRAYDVQVPFGVVREHDGQLVSIEEKPMFRQLVSAGINVFSPDVLAEISGDEYLDMPSLFSLLLEQKRTVRTYHMNGYWLDIGRPPDLARANAEFFEVFT